MAMYKRTASLEFCEDETFNINLGELLCKQREEGVYCDLELTVNGQSVHAHKGVLVARCDYFAAMFRHSFRELSATSIDMSCVFPSVGIMERILEYLYTGRIVLGDGNIDEILESASLLLLECLIKNCAQYLLINLGPHNCVHTWLLADTYGMPEVAVIARHMAKSRLQDCVLTQEDSLYIPAPFLVKVIKEAMPDLFNTDLLLNFLFKWCKTEQEEGKIEAMKCILQMKPQLEYQDEDSMGQWSNNDNGFGRQISLQLPNAASSINMLPTLQTHGGNYESLISYIMENHVDTKAIQLHVYAYLVRGHLWRSLGTISILAPSFNSQWKPIGVTDDNIIFRSLNPRQLLSVNLGNSKNVDIPFPGNHLQSLGLVTYKEFCYSQRLFCIVEDECRTPIRSPHMSMTLSEYFTIVRSLMVYDPSRNTWIPCCPLPIQEVKSRHKVSLDYHIIDAGDVAYVWAMDVDWHEDATSGGPFWIKLSLAVEEGGNGLEYQMTLEAAPPVSSQEWGNKQVKLVGTKEGILVHGHSKCNMLLYNTQTLEWSTLEEKLVIEYPHVSLPLQHGGTFKPETVHISQDMDTQCLPPSGVLFHLEDLCPEISLFWSLHLEGMHWKALPAPPVVGLRNFVVCRMDAAMLWRLKEDEIDSCRRHLADEGPLFDCRLPQSTSHFRPVPSQWSV